MKLKYRKLSFLNFKLLKFENGQSLIEVLVAFAISVLIGMALITAGLATQKSSRSAKNETQATKLAQEYLEQIRVIRDIKGFSAIPGPGSCNTIDSSNTDPSGWSVSSTSVNPLACTANPPCLGSPATMRGEKVAWNDTKVTFCRKFLVFDTATPDTVHKLKITSEVAWQEAGDTKTVTADTVLSLWCTGTVTGTGTLTCP